MSKDFFGFVELSDGEGVKAVDIHWDDYYKESAAWVDGDLADDADGMDDFAAFYGDRFFLTLDDFKAGKALSIEEVWPDGR